MELERCRGVLNAVLSHRLPNASDREDCLQTVFLLAMQQGQSVPPAFRRAWLFKVAGNQAALHGRKKRVAQRALESVGTGAKVTQESEAELPETQIIEGETHRRLNELLDQQPPLAREMIRLKFFENLTYQQIAQRLEIPLGTALTTVRRTLNRLRDRFDET